MHTEDEVRQSHAVCDHKFRDVYDRLEAVEKTAIKNDRFRSQVTWIVIGIITFTAFVPAFYSSVTFLLKVIE